MDNSTKNSVIVILSVIIALLGFAWISDRNELQTTRSQLTSANDTLRSYKDTQSTPVTIQNTSTTPVASSQSTQKHTCIDVTSYDHNWNNDMLCTRPDGSTFYTNYAGARDYEASP